MRTTPSAAALAAALLVGPAGCSGDGTARQVAARNASNIQRVANMYAAFQTYKGGRGPGDAAEFKSFIKDFDPAKLSMMGIDPAKLDAVFSSERDRQPFKIRYGAGGGRGAVVAVVFEQAGKDGAKQVGYTGGKVEAVDEATAQRLWSGKADAAPPAAGPSGRPTGPPAGAPTGPPKT